MRWKWLLVAIFLSLRGTGKARDKGAFKRGSWWLSFRRRDGLCQSGGTKSLSWSQACTAVGRATAAFRRAARENRDNLSEDEGSSGQPRQTTCRKGATIRRTVCRSEYFEQ